MRDVLYVMDDRVITSAGIASGIDLALHLVAVAARPGRGRPGRPLDGRLRPAQRRRAAGQRDAAAPRSPQRLVHRVQDLIDSRYAEPLPLADLAASGRRQRTHPDPAVQPPPPGLTPLRYQQVLRVERAEHLIGHGATVEAAARAVGFEDARMLRRLRCPHHGA